MEEELRLAFFIDGGLEAHDEVVEGDEVDAKSAAGEQLVDETLVFGVVHLVVDVAHVEVGLEIYGIGELIELLPFEDLIEIDGAVCDSFTECIFAEDVALTFDYIKVVAADKILAVA